MDELLLIKDKVTEEHKLVDEWTSGQGGRVDELLVIKDKVTEEHKLVDEWTRWTSGRVACKKRQGNRRTQVSRQVDWKTDL